MMRHVAHLKVLDQVKNLNFKYVVCNGISGGHVHPTEIQSVIDMAETIWKKTHGSCACIVSFYFFKQR